MGENIFTCFYCEAEFELEMLNNNTFEYCPACGESWVTEGETHISIGNEDGD